MKHFTSLNLRVLGFLQSQPPDLPYNWHDIKVCPAATFIKSDFSSKGEWNEVWMALDSVAGQEPWTYGELLKRFVAKSGLEVL